jgi:DNA modification methylase
MYFQDALNFDYNSVYYDLVFTSPPYYFIQKYENNIDYNNSKREMDEKFYIPVFTKVYNGLQKGGYFVINVCKEVYDNVLIKLFGEAHEIYNYGKSKRQNEYKEMIYSWRK